MEVVQTFYKDYANFNSIVSHYVEFQDSIISIFTKKIKSLVASCHSKDELAQIIKHVNSRKVVKATDTEVKLCLAYNLKMKHFWKRYLEELKFETVELVKQLTQSKGEAQQLKVKKLSEKYSALREVTENEGTSDDVKDATKRILDSTAAAVKKERNVGFFSMFSSKSQSSSIDSLLSLITNS